MSHAGLAVLTFYRAALLLVAAYIASNRSDALHHRIKLKVIVSLVLLDIVDRSTSGELLWSG